MKRTSRLNPIALQAYFLIYIFINAFTISTAFAVQQTANPDVAYTLVHGKVISVAKGIKDVVVSDGKNIYQSDSNGNFSFLTDQPFVFISYPAGYKFSLLPNGSVDFFKKLDLDQRVNELLFELEPNPHAESEHHFLVIADPQLQTEEEADWFISESAADLIQTKAELGDSNLFGVGVGDLVFDRFDLFEKYNEGIKNTGIPFFQVVGNHDIDLSARSNEASQKLFWEQYGPAYYSFNRGNRHYVVLSDVFFLGNKQYFGYLPEIQLRWLEKDLALVSKDHPLVIFLHIPSASNVYQYNSGRDPHKESLVNRTALYEILEGYEVHLMSGHVHWNENRVEKNIFEHNHGAISGAWWSGPICYDGTPKGYGVYKANENLSWYYKSVGKEKQHQIRGYHPGEHPDFPDEYGVNIWNWDPDWKVNWYEDGVLMGNPRQEITEDPLAIALYGKEAGDKKHYWVSPQKSEHLFFFKPKSNSSLLRVEVIDRFNNIYNHDFK